MKLLFVHDTKIKEDSNGTLYTSGSYSEEVWDRYLSLSSEFSVIARKEQIVYDIDIAQKGFNYFDKNKINYIEVPNLNSSLKIYIDFKGRRKLKEKIKKAVIENDYIIARLPSNNGNLAIKYAIKYNKPFLVEVVGCSWDSLWNYNLKGKILAPISYFKQKRAVRNSRYTIYVTKEFLQNRYPTKGESVNCSNVLLTDFDELIIQQRINKISNIRKKGKLLIGTTAAVDVKYKGQESIIKALAKLKKDGITNFEYQLVGGGDQTYLNSLAVEYNVSEQVKFYGGMTHKDVVNWLDTLDIYAQPSKTEGLPRALIEAMSRGLICIGSNAGGIPELLEKRYIFKNSINNEEEILTLLKEIDEINMLEQAKRNFNISKEYEKGIIESRRSSFLKRFLALTHNN